MTWDEAQTTAHNAADGIAGANAGLPLLLRLARREGLLTEQQTLSDLTEADIQRWLARRATNK